MSGVPTRVVTIELLALCDEPLVAAAETGRDPDGGCEFEDDLAFLRSEFHGLAATVLAKYNAGCSVGVTSSKRR